MDERTRHHNFVHVDRQRHSQDYSEFEPAISERKEEIAAVLLIVGALFYYQDKPFEFKSNLQSPVYIDNRLIISNPKSRDIVIENLIEKLNEIGLPDVVAGVATAGVPYAAIIAQKLDLPMVYARPAPKEHGKQNQIEGQIKSGQKAVVIEDTISTAISSTSVIDVLKKAGSQVTGEIAIFTYGMKESSENLIKAKVKLHALTDLESVIKVAAETGYLNDDQVKVIKLWSEDPQNWGK